MKPEFGRAKLDAQSIVSIRTTAKLDQLSTVMGPLFAELYGFITEGGQSPVGMPFARYYAMDGDSVDFECGMPVAPAMAGTARIQGGELPAGTMITVTHFGPYEGLGKTWGALFEWIKTQGLEQAGAPWEVYVTDPGAEPDHSKWRTDIYCPVR